MNNTYINPGQNRTCTSGDNNTVIGGYNEQQNSLDIQFKNGFVVLSDEIFPIQLVLIERLKFRNWSYWRYYLS